MSSVWLIAGAQAAGKSTTADLLARRFDPAVHVRGAHFYRWAVAGWVHPMQGDDAEARRLLDLRYGLSAHAANAYAGAGFTTVAQDTIYGDDVVVWLEAITTRPRHLVVLDPSAEAVTARDRFRRETTGKVAYKGGFTVDANIEAVHAIPRIGLWIDTSAMTPDDVVDEILARAGEATVTDDALRQSS
ncbi:MAG TPA: AAA family ATPase [Acidimicrobiales bacterium]|jgi:chloramphenicol 3-O-phosphotransferase|nr:AAA family ATPase [Acidimicrobiales bacterium]